MTSLSAPLIVPTTVPTTVPSFVLSSETRACEAAVWTYAQFPPASFYRSLGTSVSQFRAQLYWMIVQRLRRLVFLNERPDCLERSGALQTWLWSSGCNEESQATCYFEDMSSPVFDASHRTYNFQLFASASTSSLLSSPVSCLRLQAEPETDPMTRAAALCRARFLTLGALHIPVTANFLQMREREAKYGETDTANGDVGNVDVTENDIDAITQDLSKHTLVEDATFQCLGSVSISRDMMTRLLQIARTLKPCRTYALHRDATAQNTAIAERQTQLTCFSHLSSSNENETHLKNQGRGRGRGRGNSRGRGRGGGRGGGPRQGKQKDNLESKPTANAAANEAANAAESFMQKERENERGRGRGRGGSKRGKRSVTFAPLVETCLIDSSLSSDVRAGQKRRRDSDSSDCCNLQSFSASTVASTVPVASASTIALASAAPTLVPTLVPAMVPAMVPASSSATVSSSSATFSILPSDSGFAAISAPSVEENEKHAEEKDDEDEQAVARALAWLDCILNAAPINLSSVASPFVSKRQPVCCPPVSVPVSAPVSASVSASSSTAAFLPLSSPATRVFEPSIAQRCERTRRKASSSTAHAIANLTIPQLLVLSHKIHQQVRLRGNGVGSVQVVGATVGTTVGTQTEEHPT